MNILTRKVPMRRKCKYQGGCKRFPVVGGGGYCWEHESEASKEKRKTQSRTQRINSQKRQQNRLRSLHSPDNELKQEIKNYFEYHIKNNAKVCGNCGLSLAHYNDSDWFGSQHHVLVKEYFHSVAGNLQNHVVLGKFCCHGQAHTSYDNLKKMKIFPRLKAIALYLYKQLTFEERKRFPEVFLDS